MSDLISTLEQFHFIRPEWLWGLPLTVLLWLLLARQNGDQQWSNYIPKEMLAALRVSSTKQSTWWRWCVLSLCLGMVLAAAGPSWNKQTVPTVQNQNALVLVLDLSPSMLAQDLTPNRLTRAKYKLIDLLRQSADGQAALIAYAGDAHTVSPLSDDPRTIEALLPALHPDVMPSQGSNTEAAIALAQQLLADAGLPSGDILLISDGVESDAIKQISNSINSNYRLSVLAVGGTQAVPIPMTKAGFIRKANGEIVLSAVNASELLAMASSLGGRFSMLSADDSDIETLLNSSFELNEVGQSKQSNVDYDAWLDMGHWLVLLVLPLALVLFRKGVIYLIPISIALLMFAPNEAYAADFSWKQLSWNHLWQTPDQRAQQQYRAGDYEAAAKNFRRKDWSAIASYKNGAYQDAVSQLSGLDDADSLYNKGNALAFNGQLKEALLAYDEALEKQAGHEDAIHNKSVIEQLLQQQEQNQQQNQDSQESSDQQSEEQQDQNQQNQQQESNSQDQSRQESQNSQEQDSSSDQPQDQQSQEENESEQSEAEQSAENQEPDQTQEQPNADTQEQNAVENTEPEQEKESQVVDAQIDESKDSLKDASEQWLRTIQDDPSGLLRRKFDYQARQRAQQRRQKTQDKAAQERY